MFVGFIAVIIILLLIVGLMSTGVTSASGGIDQTKAVKAVSEISGIAQSTGYYKTAQDTVNYKSLTLVSLEELGIVDHNDLIETNGDGVDYSTFHGTFIDNAGAVADNTILIRSKSIDGLFYNITQNADTTNKFDLDLVVSTDLIPDNSSLAKALDMSLIKLGSSAERVSDSYTDGVAVLIYP